MRSSLSLNNKGMGMVVVVLALVIGGVSILAAFKWNELKNIEASRVNIDLTAEQIKQKLVGTVMSPEAWQITQTKNSSAFSAFVSRGATGGSVANAAEGLPIDLYLPAQEGPYYSSTRPTAGFDVFGQPCFEFDSRNGSDQCPFRYVVSLKNRILRGGNWIDTVHFKFHYLPRTVANALSTAKVSLTFDLVRNLNSNSIESGCLALGGTYLTNENSCSVQLSTDYACPRNTFYQGPPTATNKNCAPGHLTVAKTCPSGQVVKGFADNGSPICARPI